MANKKQENFTSRINITGSADFSAIISSLNRMYSVIEGKANQTDVLNIDKSLNKIKELQSQIQKQQQKGLLNQSEITSYNKNISQLLRAADQLGTKFSTIKLTGLEDSIIEAKRNLKAYQKELADVIRNANSITKGSISNSKYRDPLLNAMSRGTAGDADRLKYEQAITKELQSQYLLDKQIADEKKKDLDNIQTELDRKTKIYEKGKLILENQKKALAAADLSTLGLARKDFTRPNPTANNPNARVQINNERYNQLNQAFKAAISNPENTTANKVFKEFSEALGDAKTNAVDIKKAITELFNEFNSKISTISGNVKEYSSIVNTLESSRKKASDTYTRAAIKADKSEQAYTKTTSYFQSSEYQGSLNAINQSIARQTTAENDLQAAEAQRASILATLNSETSQLNTNISKSSQAQEKNAEETNRAAIAQRNYDDALSRLQYHIKYILSITNAWRQVRSIVTQTYNDVTKLDKAFAEIAMVTNYSVSDMWGQYGNYAEMANKLGQTTESVIQASGLYYQQGK